MSEKIVPILGQGLAFTQNGPGTTPGYSAIDDRVAFLGMQEGVLPDPANGASNPFHVEQRGTGANMSVDVQADDDWGAIVRGDAVTHQGLYFVRPHSAVINISIPANNSGLPVLHQCILRVYDHAHDGSGLNEARIELVEGTPTAGATKDNGLGLASLPGSSLRLGIIEVANGAITIVTSNIRDRRTWATGANARKSSGSAFSTGSTTEGKISSSFDLRVECSGKPIEVTFLGSFSSNNNTGTYYNQYVRFAEDDVAITDAIFETDFMFSAGNTLGMPHVLKHQYTPAAGSHIFTPYWRSSSGAYTFFLNPNANSPLAVLMVREVRGRFTDNG